MNRNELAAALRRPDPPLVIDVRSGWEFRAGHIAGALNLPVWKLPVLKKQLPADHNRLLVVTCEHGPRAQLAGGLLKLAGFRNIELLQGHMLGWKKAGLPLEKS